MRNLISVLVMIGFPVFAWAQTQARAEGSSPKDSAGIDTNYVHVYKDMLVLGVWQSERRFDIHFDQKQVPGLSHTEINYIANSNQVTGFSFDYDIIGFSLGLRSVASTDKRRGNSDYLDLGLNINTRKLRIENSYRRYTGFYDLNTPKYTVPFTDSTPYYQDPALTLKSYKAKLVYVIRPKKFALGAAYANVRRQIRSAGSFILVGNFYGMGFFSNQSIIPAALQQGYGMIWDGLHRINIYAYSAGAGYTHSFVIWKKVCLNFLFSLGLEKQYRHYYIQPENIHYSYWKNWVAADWRTSLGYNGKRFFIRATNIIDISSYDSEALTFRMQFIAGSFDFGYRFNFKAPKPYRKFQESKVYKML